MGVGTGVRMMTDMFIFAWPYLLVLQACFCVTQSVRCWVKEILSNRVSVLSCMQCLNLHQDFNFEDLIKNEHCVITSNEI